MNKRFLLVAALCAAMNLSSFAQDNLALNKPVAVSSGTNSENVVDGNLNTRWEVATGDEKQNGGVVEEGSYWFYIDLEKSETFNTLRIRWEGGYAKKFKVLVQTNLTMLQVSQSGKMRLFLPRKRPCLISISTMLISWIRM